MPRVSRRLLERSVTQEINELFCSMVANLKKATEVEQFLNDFLTTEEKLMLSKRLAVVLLIVEGYDYRLICNILKVSPTTVNTAKQALKTKGPAYRRVIETLVAQEQLREFWEKVNKFMQKLPLTRKQLYRWGRGL